MIFFIKQKNSGHGPPLLCFLLCLTIVLGVSLNSSAAEIEAPVYDLRIAGEGRESHLTLNQAIAHALRSNLDIQIEAISPQVEADRTLQATAEFDPAFENRFRYDTLATPQTSQEFVSTGGNRFLNGNLIGLNRIFYEDNVEAKSGLVGKLRTGTEYDIGVRANRYTNDLTRDPTVAIFNPEYRTFTGITFLQPLLQDFGRCVNESQIRVSQRDKAIADQVFRQKLTTTVKDVVVAYYDAFLAYEDTKVKRFEVEVLRRMVEEKSDQLERGAATESDAAMIRSSLSESYERFLLARQTLLAKNGDLLLLLQQDFDFGNYPVYLPVDAPSGLRPTLDPRLLVSEAIKCRPEYLMAVETVEKLGIVLKYRENQMLPRVDLEGTIGYSGLSGSWGNAFSNTADGQGTDYGVGLVVSMPLGNTEKKALYAETEHQKKQALLKLKQEEHHAHILISQHITAVQTHEKRLMAARLSTRLEMENLEKSRESLEKGAISESMILKVERDISETRLRQYAAAADLQKSLADLWETNGTLLSRHRIAVSGATQFDPARVTSADKPLRSEVVVLDTDSADRLKTPDPRKLKSASETRTSSEKGQNPLESAFSNLFVKTEKGSGTATGKTLSQTTLVASPIAAATPESMIASPVTEDTLAAGDPASAELIASPVKSKGLRNLFEKR